MKKVSKDRLNVAGWGNHGIDEDTTLNSIKDMRIDLLKNVPEIIPR